MIFRSGGDNRDAVVLIVLQGAVVPSGRKIIDSPEGYGPFSRLLRWAMGPVDLATVTHNPPGTRKNGPITGRMDIIETASRSLVPLLIVVWPATDPSPQGTP